MGGAGGGAGGAGGMGGGAGGAGGGAGGAGGGAGGAGGAGGVPMPVEDCDNTTDDDGDAAIDCADSDCTASAVCGTLVINELEYDQTLGDTDEFIEILNTGAGPVDLAGVRLVFVSSSNNAPYLDIPLQGTLAAGQYLVVASATVAGIDPGAVVVPFAKAADNFQNGPADAVAIFDGTNQKVIDSISYEGSITTATIDGGTYNLVSGTPTLAQDYGNAAPVPLISMIRRPNGQDTNDDAADWSVTTIITPGAPNQQSAEACGNMWDDDFDTFMDCADTDCAAEPACLPVEICDNGLDDEGDMLADCADTMDCEGQACSMFGSVCMAGACTCPGGLMESACGDLADNDCDGDVDCGDADCFVDPVCSTTKVTAVSYQVITRGGKLVVTGANFTGATEVTVGGAPQAYVVDSDAQITIDLVGETTPLGAQDLVVTTPNGPTAPFGLTVINLLINELDADQAGTDMTEFIEISAGVPGVNLTGYTLVLWNGAVASGTYLAYNRLDLNGVTDANGLLLVGTSGVMPAPAILLSAATNAIQNGEDGISIHQAPVSNFVNGTTAVTAANLIDALVYGTADPESTGLLNVLLGPAGAPERVQLDEGTMGLPSIQRCAEGRRDGRRFAVGEPATPGAANNVPPCP